MILRLTQTKKELFSAYFVIERGSEKIGEVVLKGKAGTMEADISGMFREQNFEMSYGKSRYLEEKAFRPYILRQEKTEIGSVYQAQHKISFFKNIDFIRINKTGILYDLFPIAFGDEGGKSPIYCGSQQIAQIEKECIVYDDLHHYEIYAVDEKAGWIALLFGMYMYVNACYKPGVKAYSSKSKTFSVTKEPYLLEKYNPYFKNTIKE